MKTKTNVLNVVIILSILLFAIAFYFNTTRIDNSEIVTSKPLQQTIDTKQVSNNQLDTNTTSDNISKLDADPETQHYTNDEIVENINNRLNKALMYNTPEKVIDAIDYYKKAGDAKKEQEFIDYLIEAFPDYNY